MKLKPDVKWHDGTPFTAEDVKYNIELIQNPKFLAGRRKAGHELVRDITVVSPTELTWRLEKPYAPYPAILSWTFFVPKHIFEKEADLNKPAFVNKPVGTGPFTWVERSPGRPHHARGLSGLSWRRPLPRTSRHQICALI